MKSRVVALSAIAAAFIAIFLTLGAYIEIIDMIAVLAAALFVTLPAYYGSKKGCILTYLVGGVLAFIFSGANIYSLVFITYFAYFGLIPALDFIVGDKLKKAVWKGIKFAWFAVVMAGVLLYYIYVLGVPIEPVFDLFGKTYDFSFIDGFIYIFIAAYALVSAFIFWLFDKYTALANAATNRLLKRILKDK